MCFLVNYDYDNPDNQIFEDCEKILRLCKLAKKFYSFFFLGQRYLVILIFNIHVSLKRTNCAYLLMLLIWKRDKYFEDNQALQVMISQYFWVHFCEQIMNDGIINIFRV